MARKNQAQAKVEWTYPCFFENAIYKVLSWEGFGVYCISRKFRNKETILYIGKTKNQFIDRLADHENKWLNDYKGQKYVRFGTITIPEKVTRDVLNDVESGLIYELKPIQNTQKLITYSWKRSYMISNIGNRGSIPAKIDMDEH